MQDTKFFLFPYIQLEIESIFLFKFFQRRCQFLVETGSIIY